MRLLVHSIGTAGHVLPLISLAITAREKPATRSALPSSASSPVSLRSEASRRCRFRPPTRPGTPSPPCVPWEDVGSWRDPSARAVLAMFVDRTRAGLTVLLAGNGECPAAPRPRLTRDCATTIASRLSSPPSRWAANVDGLQLHFLRATAWPPATRAPPRPRSTAASPPWWTTWFQHPMRLRLRLPLRVPSIWQHDAPSRAQPSEYAGSIRVASSSIAIAVRVSRRSIRASRSAARRYRS